MKKTTLNGDAQNDDAVRGEALLKALGEAEMVYVEEAVYKKERKTPLRPRRMLTAAACLAAVIPLSAAVYAFGARDALRAYFTPQTEAAGALLQSDETLIVDDQSRQMRVDNMAADARMFCFTVALNGVDRPSVGETIDTVWITRDGERVTNFNKEFGAYTDGFAKGSGFRAGAVSLYDDADAVFMVINRVPADRTIEDMAAVELTCDDMVLTVAVPETITKSYSAVPKEGTPAIRHLSVSAIGFSGTAVGTDEDAVKDIRLITTDGAYVGGEDYTGEAEDGFFGFSISVENDETGDCDFFGTWAGDGAVAVGILDLSRYSGIRIGEEDYFFEAAS